MPLEPFTPDFDYCVYCHAAAAGMCASCGAICCVDCVELVMGWTQRRAVCRNCLAATGPVTSHRRAGIAMLVLLVAVVVAGVLLWR